MWIGNLHGRDRDGEERAFWEMWSSQCTSGVLGLGQTLHVCLCCICSCAEMTCQSADPTGKCNLTKRKKGALRELSLEGGKLCVL